MSARADRLAAVRRSRAEERVPTRASDGPPRCGGPRARATQAGGSLHAGGSRRLRLCAPRRPGDLPVHAGRPADDVPRPPLDDAPVRGLRHRRGVERALPLPAGAGPDRPLGRVRPADADGLRLRPSAGRGRGRQGRRAIDSLEDMETLFAGIPLDDGQHLDDDQRDGADPAGAVRGGRQAAGRAAARQAGGTIAERHPEGVHRAGDVHLSAARRRCGWSRTSSLTARQSCRAGTRSASAATTCARPARRRRRSWPSRWRTPSPTCDAALRARADDRHLRAAAGVLLRQPQRSASRRSPSSGRPGGCGRRSCASGSARQDPRSWMLRFHTQTAGVDADGAADPTTTSCATTMQALAAVLGGTQSLHTNARDEALALPTEAAAELALRTQQILAYESGVADTVDPLAGLVLRRVADGRPGAAGAGVHRAHRRAGRRAGGHRAGLDAGRDTRERLPLPARGRARRAGDRGRQSLHHAMSRQSRISFAWTRRSAIGRSPACRRCARDETAGRWGAPWRRWSARREGAPTRCRRFSGRSRRVHARGDLRRAAARVWRGARGLDLLAQWSGAPQRRRAGREG